MDILKAFCSWSGGKDSCLSLYRTIKGGQVRVSYLLNMLAEDGRVSRSHGISSELLKIQADALGIPIFQRNASWNNYENEFKIAVREMKKDGIMAGVFGDIDLHEHREWVERVCEELDINPILPLWNESRERLLKEFISSGFKAIVCSVNCEFLGEEWLGREIDENFIEDLKALPEVDLCGEKGEYHTFVFDGPIFKRKVNFKIGEKRVRDKKYFLELKP
ncbi:diphthine--ammonia ligase [Thermodesulfovibrio sp.]|uniref:Dph6-related ATP pyrophosphatase n=1 Tax=Thermodesulfovibrio sp. TaxID=2067987 RepID=UPI0030962BB3